MKKTIFLGLALVSLTAFFAVQHKKINPPKNGLPNPASQYCVEQGGKLEIRNETNGQVGYCHLPNGQVVEEWKLFRDNQANCVAEEAQKLVGLSGLTDDQIKQKTKSEIVRKVAPGQPMTMDYRSNRVTVTIDPATKKITNANCG
ncbi:I78 family peptidase inhibitor [Acinetobacter sp. 796380-1375]|uniref:I78 family peptidase inhibitor n=1 Tax=Acinetobacter sp. 796380-1375 TaxID=1310833 RepID=UPI000461BB0E|nr:I78 family peptidase inhibitor [Acinetobacter sp. 796380-1375]KCY74058.1 peptidase inhibitor I78 family protein [Acinetobacter sp. 796380-1375]